MTRKAIWISSYTIWTRIRGKCFVEVRGDLLRMCCLKGQVFVVWIDLPAIETCILVEIDLQVYIFARKVGLTGPKVYFHILLFAQ